MATIADILMAKGDVLGRAASQRGNIYAQLIGNLSSLPGQVIQQTRADQRDQMEQQAQQQRLALLGMQAKNEAELQPGRVQAQRLQNEAGEREATQSAGLDAVWKNSDIFNADGSVNREGVLALATQRAPGAVPHVLKTLDDLDASRANLLAKQQALTEAQRETLGKDALQLEAAGNDAGLFHLLVASRAKDGVIQPEQAEALIKLSDPKEIGTVTARWKAGSTQVAKLQKDAADVAHTKAETGKLQAETTGTLPKTPAQVETERHNREQERISGLTAGRAEATAKETHRHNLAMEASARNRVTSRPMLSGDANRIADIDTSLNEAMALTKILDHPGDTGVLSQIGQQLPNFVTEFTGGIGETAKMRQAQIAKVRQIIGKALEGGVLRKEDEIKYKDILPTIGDTTDVVKSKLTELGTTLRRKRETTLEALGDAGFNVEAMKTRGAPAETSAVPANVAAALKTAKPGRHTLSDGSVWTVNADGSVTK